MLQIFEADGAFRHTAPLPGSQALGRRVPLPPMWMPTTPPG